ncbi:MAG: ABC transporter ATP-binding protein/permease [Anaerolineae bacterium]|nr:ABC transporter ATP-binding protein/permease [Anaerolineae bacterium]
MSVDTPSPIHLRRPGGGRIVLRCLSYLRPHRALVVGAYLLLLINNVITLGMPLIIGHTVDQGIRAGDASVIRLGAVALLALALLRGVLTFLLGRWTEVASQNVAYDLRNAIHDKLQSLSFSYHDQAETGQLLARAIGDVDRVRFLTGRAILRLVEVVTLVLGIAIAMMVMNLRLALPTLVIVPLLTYVALTFGRLYRPLWGAIREQISELTAHLEQNLRGSRIVKAFAQEPAEIRRFDTANAKFFDLHMIASRTRAMYLPLLRLIASAGIIAVILYGGQLVIREELTIGELVAFSTYVGQLLVPVRRLGMIVSAIAESIASGERIFEILDARSEVEDLPGARPVENVRGHVRFEHVSFSYFERNPVLKDIDFGAEPGQVVALLGATGSGKSSVINLVPRFYDPTRGRVLLDGHDIRYLTVASLREQIGIVLQDTTLFATTVRENIAFGRPDAGEEEIIAAARAASAHDFIMEMPQGYETAVGERGMTLSGGQKQRIAIARAILKDPRILILDDATSSVDTETEALIQAALARLMKGRTSFVIAQRLSTLRQADQVLVIEKGRIAARGYRTTEHTAHDELLRTSGLYAEIYYQQLRPRELDGHLRKDDSS